ncbi:hypothetical protein LC048_12960 [Mesobacillus subterraneus]|nr:hypothetical protein [Mesobacillus subterraneus]WLR53447.1 hypothetical protein LC048_12960 [Mesobacillus subterraneus]
MKSFLTSLGGPKRLEGLGVGAGQRKAETPWSAPTSAGGPTSEVVF